MRILLILGGFFGAALIYEGIVRLVEQGRRAEKEDDARKHRIRVLNQQGQPPHEIVY